MELVDQEMLEGYLADDGVAKLYASIDPRAPARKLQCQSWLESTPAKRMIFDRLYGDILRTPSRAKVVDVGGGLTALTPLLASKCDYFLIDPLHHDSEDDVRSATESSPKFHLDRSDWHTSQACAHAEVIIANDLFPNVDQRLALFLDWALRRAPTVRLALTFYNSARWYETQRIGAAERLCVLAFDGARTRAAMAPYAHRVRGWRPDLFEATGASVYPNGRHVILATLDGES
jgi:hypothetical protein